MRPTSMADSRNQLVFNRFTREEMGLPPFSERTGRRRVKAFFIGMALVFALWAAGWIAGGLTAGARSRSLGGLPGRVLRADPGKAGELLSQGRVLATAINDDPLATLFWCEAAMIAAERAPRRLGWFGNLARLLDGLGGRLGNRPGAAFRAETLHAHVLSELGRHSEAFAALGRAERALSALPDESAARALRLHLVNQQSYLLATAPENAGRDPDRALRLAQTMISSRDEIGGGEFPSGSAAFVDTLAAAWFAAGNRDRAVEAQTLALGLAKSGDLAVYLEHCDAYRQARLPARSELVAHYVLTVDSEIF